MTQHERHFVQTLRGRLAEEKPLIQVLLGPRQVGKTTGLKAALGERGVYHTADYPTPLGSDVLMEWWDEAERDPSRILAVDEVQKITNWSETIKYLWDQAESSQTGNSKLGNIKLVLTGSSSLLVEKGLKETLAGRFELIRAEHWNFEEAARVFGLSLRDYIEYGCYPGAVSLLGDVSRWGSYVRDAIVEPAIGRDLLQLHPVDNPALLRQIFLAAVSHPAQLLSTQKMQGSIEERGSIPTLRHYVSLLSQAFLVTGIEKYSTSLLKTRSSVPKFVIHDTALCRSFERPITDPIGAERFGRYFENMVAARFIEAGWDTYYWKYRDYEVDLVVLGPNNEKWAIEVKSSETSMSAMRGVVKFCEQYADFTPCLLSLCDQRVDGVKHLDVREILSLHR